VKRLAVLLALLPAPALAGTAQVDVATVQQCFDKAAPGEVAPACLGAAAKACQAQPGGDTTLGISECLQGETAAWDKLLNTSYKALRADFRQQGDGLPEALLKAQRAWIAFRDAQCALDYQRWGGGSMRTIAAADCLMTMTAARAIELRDMGEPQ